MINNLKLYKILIFLRVRRTLPPLRGWSRNINFYVTSCNPKYGCPYQVSSPNKKYIENIQNTIINKCSSKLEYIPIDIYIDSNNSEVKCENKECKVDITTKCNRLDGFNNLSEYPKIIL
jgi:hypothetical protein